MLRGRLNILLYGERDYLDPASIPKFINQLEKPYIYYPIMIKKKNAANKKKYPSDYEEIYFIDICRFYKQILPEGYPKTPVIGWAGLVKGYDGGATGYAKSYPGGIFELKKHIPARIKWRTKTGIPVRMSCHMADKDNTVPGPYRYSCKNSILSFKGFYILRREKGSIQYNSLTLDLPPSKYEYPIIIQDCSFYKDGSMVNSGEIIVVNGRVWPNMNVKRRQYRLYILNASESKSLNLTLSNEMSLTVIGEDKGLLFSPVRKKEILLEPGKIVDVLIDFSGQPKGSKIILQDAYAANPETGGQIMSFFIPEYEALSIRPVKLPDKLRL